MKQTDFARILTRYLADFLPGQQNVSSNTIKSYRDTFKQLLLYLQEEYMLVMWDIRCILQRCHL
jgi:integrase/recombinase XerD